MSSRRRPPWGHALGHATTAGEEPHGLVIRSRRGEVLHAAAPPIVHALRYTIAKLQLEDKNALPGRLGVTAAYRGEGVSYVSRSLAAVVAHDSEQSVCLIDLNWWSDREADAPAGVAEVLRGTTSLDEALVGTDNPRLVLLPAGHLADEDRAVVAKSLALQGLLDDLETRFHHLIIDLPPVLVTSETLTLAGYGEACMVVTHQGVTPGPAVQRALQLLGTVRVLGIVLNRASSRVPKAVLRRLALP